MVRGCNQTSRWYEQYCIRQILVSEQEQRARRDGEPRCEQRRHRLIASTQSKNQKWQSRQKKYPEHRIAGRQALEVESRLALGRTCSRRLNSVAEQLDLN